MRYPLASHSREIPVRVGIVGYGIVGRYLHCIFTSAHLDTVVYDKYVFGFWAHTQKLQRMESP
jgi:phosphoglycerate dehydrogenase-like enzyme